ncbi:hypothetical protein B0H34DRAFT_642008, partial [Crassisporium funariophilum]
PSNTTPSIPSTAYLCPLPSVSFLTRARILTAIGLLKPHKAPGPDMIPNIVLKQCAHLIVNHLVYIFNAVLELDVYHDSWLISTTLVLWKPGKAAYNIAKAYHPIGL